MNIADRATSDIYIDEVYPEADKDTPLETRQCLSLPYSLYFCCSNYFVLEKEPDFRVSVFIRGLAENYFSTALLACPSKTELLFTPNVDGKAVHNAIAESYYKLSGQYFADSLLDYAWQYSEKVRKGEI